MTDEQFDEICRGALAFDPGPASGSTWSRIRPTKRSWLPTIPEILACGCACGLALLVVGLRFQASSGLNRESNPVVQKAMSETLTGLQASAVEIQVTTEWPQRSPSWSFGYGYSVLKKYP